MKDKISERKQKILQVLVDNYIVSAEPQSSSGIKDNCQLDISSATIRNELVALEEMGYLVQPHISAGRIPSPKAYKYYVENLLTEFDSESLKDIQSSLTERFSEIEEIIIDTARIISNQTNYTSIILLDNIGDTIIKNVNVLNLFDGQALVLIVTDNGILKDKVVDLPKSLQDSSLNAVNIFLNNIFSGRKLKEFKDSKLFMEFISEYRLLCEKILNLILNYKEKNENKIYLDGTDKIFKYKEYENVENIKNFLSIVNSKEKLHYLISNDTDIEFSVKIGKDDSTDLDNMAMVTAKYRINGREIGHAGVIGPERMDYKTVIKALKQLGQTINIVDAPKKEE